MKVRTLLLAAAAAAAGFAAPAPASAGDVCVSAQASGVFIVVNVGPVCVPTPLPTFCHSVSTTVGLEKVTVVFCTP